VRDIIAVKAVRFRVEEDVGYLRVISFTEKTYDDLSDAIEKISEEIGEDKLKGFVLDLAPQSRRSARPGDQRLRRLPRPRRNRLDPRPQSRETRRFNSRPGDLTGGKPVVVLINGGSASRLRDRRRRAAGSPPRHHSRHPVLRQGLRPDDHTARRQTALRLTTALYYTPSGTSIQGTGIKPDIRVEQPIPEELRGRVKPSGESALRGHIQGENEDEEGSGSIAYVPPDPEG
jgi:carboxyl-terminal processing protease